MRKRLRCQWDEHETTTCSREGYCVRLNKRVGLCLLHRVAGTTHTGLARPERAVESDEDRLMRRWNAVRDEPRHRNVLRRLRGYISTIEPREGMPLTHKEIDAITRIVAMWQAPPLPTHPFATRQAAVGAVHALIDCRDQLAEIEQRAMVLVLTEASDGSGESLVRWVEDCNWHEPKVFQDVYTTEEFLRREGPCWGAIQLIAALDQMREYANERNAKAHPVD